MTQSPSSRPAPNAPTPPQIFDRALLQVRRARAAPKQDKSDFLLERACADFIDRLDLIKRQFDMGLILGAHNSDLAAKLTTTGKCRFAISADACPALLAATSGPRIAIDEEYLPLKPETLDLIISPLTLQWVNDLPGTLTQIRASLKPDGLFMGALLGGDSLHELRHAFLAAETEIMGGATPRVAPFADIRALGALLQRAGLALPVVDRDLVNVRYASAIDLMSDLRAMGATNMLRDRSRTPLKRSVLTRAVEIYHDQFADNDGRIPASFEIIHMSGWAPHESQQQPLKPGSAKTRLADALKHNPKKL